MTIGIATSLVPRAYKPTQKAKKISSPIPSFYRIFCTTVDPILALTCALTCLFAPAATLKGFSPTAVIPPATETLFCLHNLAGFYAGTALLQIFLLRARPTNVIVWRAVQFSIFLVDIAMLAGFARSLTVTGRTHWNVWRIDE